MGNIFLQSFWLDSTHNLPALGADPDAVTISGFSSGASLASCLHIIYSGTIKGSGQIAGTPYGFSRETRDSATTELYTDLIAKVLSEKKIDDTANLKDDPVYILGFDRDNYVRPEYNCIEHTKGIFDSFGAKTLHEQKDYVHCVPNDLPVNDNNPSRTCQDSSDIQYFISNCGFDTAGRLLGHLLTNLEKNPISSLKARNEKWWDAGVLKKFNQREFLESTTIFDYSGLAQDGYVFIPNNCIDGTTSKCKLHINFHGTGMGHAYIGDNYFKRAGWLEYAAANDIILMFPQADFGITNPLGTWDMQVPQRWHYTEPWLGYLTPTDQHTVQTNLGVQPKAFKAMIDRVISPKEAGVDNYKDNALPTDIVGGGLF